MEQTHEIFYPIDAETTGRPARPPRRPGPLLLASAALAFAMVALLGAAVLRPAASSLTHPQRPAPDFTLSLYGGGTLALHQLRGKTVVLNFWWSDCVPCIQEAPILEQQWRAWRAKDVVFVGIDKLDTAAAAVSFLKQYGVSYPNGPDPGDLTIQYGTTGQPETFVISPRGVITAHSIVPFTTGAQLATLIQEARA